MSKSHTFSTRSGDGYWCPTHGDRCFQSCDDRRWGRFGAAGVLFVHSGTGRIFLNQRSPLIHFGGTWSTLGGALDADETSLEGALREAAEEMGGKAPEGRVVASVTDTVEGGWTYTTFVIEVDDLFRPESKDWESTGFGWFSINEMAVLPLHPGFRKTVSRVLAAWYYQER